MTDEGRKRFFMNVFGMPGMGKTHFAQQFAYDYVNAGQGPVLVLNFGKENSWNKDFKMILCKDIPGLVTKAPALYQYRQADCEIYGPKAKKAIADIEVFNGLVIVDDAPVTEDKTKPTNEMKMLINNYRQRHLDIMMLWHSMNEPARAFYSKSSMLVLFPTASEPDKKYDKIPEIDEVRAAWKRVTLPYHAAAKGVKEKIKRGLITLQPGQSISDYISPEIKHNFERVDIRY